METHCTSPPIVGIVVFLIFILELTRLFKVLTFEVRRLIQNQNKISVTLPFKYSRIWVSIYRWRIKIAFLYSCFSMPMQRCITWEITHCTVCTPSTVRTLRRTNLLSLSTSCLYTTQDFSVELRSELIRWVWLYWPDMYSYNFEYTPPLFLT